MARSKGSANLAASLEVLAGAPLDARLVVDNLTDLITASTFPYNYVGMPVAVKSEEAIYMLTDTPTTTIDNWKKIGSDEAPETYWGYLYNNKFWEESTHTTEITAATDTLYITKDTDSFYKYTGTDYVKIGGGDAVVYQPGGSYLFANIPALSAATLGFVYDVQDAFTTTSDFLEGAGIDYPAGTNIVVVNTGTAQSPVYKYDVLIGELSGYQKKIQYNALPTANADELGNIYQYMGATTVYLKNGHFYQCVSDGEPTPTYSWQECTVQTVSGGGHSIKDNGVDMDARAALNFVDFDLTDNSGDDETDVAAHRLTSDEMAEIMSTLPGTPTDKPVLFDERGTEYQVGWYVLSDGTKKPVYEKHFFVSGATVTSYTNYDISTASLLDNDHIEPIGNIFGGYYVDYNTNTQQYHNFETALIIANINANYGYCIQYRQVEKVFRINGTWGGTDATLKNINFALRYTKTTDTPS